CAGREQWFVSRGTVVYESGRPVRIVGQLRDISARKAAEARLRESEERFRTISETVPLAISIARADDGQLLFTNAYWSTMFGLDPDQALKTSARRFYEDPAHRDLLVDAMSAHGEVENLECRLRRH